jgi:phosphoribosylformimino-5-aminoimidazole carboxamide ribotide isomerase
VAVAGWAETSAVDAVEHGRRFAKSGVAAIIYTDIARDGGLTGIDAAAIADFARQVELPVIASGGIASLDDIAQLQRREADGIAGAICGRAFYDGSIDPRAALQFVAERR